MIFYNCREVGYFAKDCPNPMRQSCKYCRLLDHEIEDCPILLTKMKDKQSTPTQNIQRVKMEPRSEDPYVKIITCSMVTQGARKELAD